MGQYASKMSCETIGTFVMLNPNLAGLLFLEQEIDGRQG